MLLLLLLINWLHLPLASALIEHPLFGMAWFCIPYKSCQDYLNLRQKGDRVSKIDKSSHICSM